MANNYDALEEQAFRSAGVMPGTFRGKIDDDRRRQIDSFLYQNINNNPSWYKDDARASKYLNPANKTYEQRLAASVQEMRNGVNPGDIWKGWGGDQEAPLDDGTLEQEETTQDQQQNSQPTRDEVNETEDNSQEELPDAETPPEETSEPEVPGAAPAAEAAPAEAGAAGSGTGAAVGEGLAGAGAEAGEALAGAAGAGEAAVGAGAVVAAETAGAGVAAGTAAAASQATPVGWVLDVVIALVIVILLVGGFTALNMKYPDTASALTPSPGTTTGQPQRDSIVAAAKKEVDAKVCGTGNKQNAGDPQKYVNYTCGLPLSGSSPWCAGFAGWVYGHAGAAFPHTCGANEMMAALKYKYDIAAKIPKPGDMIQKDHHIAIVYKIEGTTLFTIEGNASTCVIIKQYSNYGRNSWLKFGNSFEAE